MQTTGTKPENGVKSDEENEPITDDSTAKDESMVEEKSELQDDTLDNSGSKEEDEESDADTSQNQTNDSTFNDSSTSAVSVRGKRERKKIERLEFTVKEKEEPTEEEGIGTPLREIPFINKALVKCSYEDLKIIHRIAFGRPGAQHSVRRNLYKFKGFPFTKNDEAYEKKKATLSKLFISDLKKMLAVFGVDRSGTKDDLVLKVVDFMLDPHDTGKTIPQKKSRKSTSKRAKKGGKGSKKKATPKAKKEKKETPAEDENTNGDVSSDDTSSDEDNEVDEEKEEVEKATPKKAPTPKKTPTTKKTPAAKKTPKSTPKTKKTPEPKKPSAKKAPAKRPRTPSTTTDSDSDADEPLVKIAKKVEPTDEEISAFIKRCLDSANLEEVTMKKLCLQVYEHYPDHDLSHKKDFIKTTVKSILA